MAVNCVLHDKRSKNNKRFFSKPHLTPELVIKTRKLSSGINSHTLKVIVFKSKISNYGRGSSEKAHLTIKIDDIIDDFEPRPWIVIGTDGDYTKPEQIQELTIMCDEDAYTPIATLIPKNN